VTTPRGDARSDAARLARAVRPKGCPDRFDRRFDKNADGTYSAPSHPGIDAELKKESDGTFKLEWRR
jgi:hypothetical protein